MAPGCTSQRGKHRSGVCRTCQSGICHDCCKCRRSVRGRPHKQDAQPETRVARLIRNQPHRNCTPEAFSDALTEDSVAEETHVPEEQTSSHSRENIFNVLSLLHVNAENDVKHLPSAEQRESATVKDDFMSPDGFRRVESLFWKGVKGWIKMLLPSWSLPHDKVLKQLFQLPSGPFEDEHVAEVEDSHDHSMAR